MNIDPDKVRIVIGPGGKTINKIIEETGVKIDISEEIPGLVSIYSVDQAGAEEARRQIEMLTKDRKSVRYTEGTVTRIMNFGAFIEILLEKKACCTFPRWQKAEWRK